MEIAFMDKVLNSFSTILSTLTTQNIVNRFQFLDPLVFIKDWRYMTIFVIVMLVLIYRQMVRTIALLCGAIFLWVVGYYYFPKGGTTLHLENMLIFIGATILVVGIWIYVIMIRHD